MKSERNNKYNGLKAVGLSIVLLGGIVLSGCVKENDITELTPTEIVEATSMPTSKPKPTLRPTPTPIPTNLPINELSYEEEVDLLDIPYYEYYATFGDMVVINYEINGITKVAFTYLTLHDDEFALANWFSDDHMFKAVKDIQEHYWDQLDDSYFEPIIDSLSEAKITYIYHSMNIRNYFPEIGLDISNSQYDYILNPPAVTNEELVAVFKTSLTLREYADLYLSIVPKLYRVSAEELRTGILENEKATMNNLEKVLVK